MIAVHCPCCKRLLFYASGYGPPLEIKCPRCDVVVRWPSTQPEIVPTEEDDPQSAIERQS